MILDYKYLKFLNSVAAHCVFMCADCRFSADAVTVNCVHHHRQNRIYNARYCNIRQEYGSPVTRGWNLEKRGNFYLMIDYGSQGVPEWESDGCHSGIFEHFFSGGLEYIAMIAKITKILLSNFSQLFCQFTRY